VTRPLGLAGLLALAAPIAASAQEVVQGVVREAGSGHPVSGAQVSTLPRGPLAWTDTDGHFRLVVPTRPDSLRIIAIGYGATRLALAAGASVDVVLVPLTVVLPELVSTAGRFEERAAEITAPVVTISKAEIEAEAAVATDQVVSQLPGLQSIPTPPAGTAIAIRGIGDSRVLVLVDGEPVAGALLQSTDLSRLSTVAVQRIEVTKGPMSSVYGSDALGGVINLVTQGPPQALRLGASARTGSFGRLEGYGEAGGTFGKVGFSVTGGVRQQEAVPGTNSSGADPLERIYDVRSSFRLAASRRVALRADLMYNYERQRWPLAGGGGFNGFTDISGISGWTEATLDAAGGVWRARVFAEHFEYRYRSARGDLPIENSGTTQNETLVRGLVAHSRRSGANSLDVGAQASLRNVEAPDRILSDQASDEQVEVYAQDVLRLGKVLLNGGARYTWNSQWNGNLSPSLGVAWEPVNQVRVKASVARGFRGPSLKERSWDFTNGPAQYVILGNPDLVPESSWAIDAAVAYAPWPALALELAGFRNNIENLIDFNFDGSVNDENYAIYTPTNIALARTQGIEASARWASGTWSLSAGYTYLNARNLVDDLPLSRRAAHSGRLRATKVWGLLRRLRTDVTALYTGSAPIIGDGGFGGGIEVTGEQGAFLQWNVGLQLGVFPSLALNAGVNNLLNQAPENWSGLIERRFWVGFSTQWTANGGGTQ
jgi:outer membrane receptor for ferrienterochelin and colicins